MKSIGRSESLLGTNSESYLSESELSKGFKTGNSSVWQEIVEWSIEQADIESFGLILPEFCLILKVVFLSKLSQWSTILASEAFKLLISSNSSFCRCLSFSARGLNSQ